MKKYTYREFVDKTALNSSIEHAVVGLCAEAGEVANLYKKKQFQGKTVTTQDFINELGDVRWYLELACKACGVTLAQVEENNIHKLKERYGL